MPDDRLEHAKVGSWFLGPRAENFGLLKDLFNYVLEEQKEARKNLYSDDPTFITAEMQATDSFKESVEGLWDNVKGLSGMLAQHSIPFWSPRYNAHMNMDTALPGIIGYMTTMMYNPNNVATEASPFTTLVERDVGQELCRILGYNTANNEGPNSWGHITCDGSVANLEAIWAARNLKFYPLSLKLAMKPGKELAFLTTIEPPFSIENCKGEKKLFGELSTWEMLNLKPSTVLDIPTRLYETYGISSSFLQGALSQYLIQTVGKDLLENEFEIKQPAKFFVSITKHYSWPKGGAITGIGSENFIDVNIDLDARMDVEDLKKHLDFCIAPAAEKDRTPVFGVVAIMGSTEHGACDPLAKVIQIRNDYEKKGLSFVVHCDAAWGGYFASMVQPILGAPERELPFVPTLALQPYTEQQLRELKHADSITIDPHKSGYVNYPAGGLCYRDERMRYLITWTSPIVFHAASGDALESMGVYGVEGSKPGASPAAIWLTHQTLGLGPGGYGRLLGEALFTCTKLYCYWAVMTMNDPDLIVVPLIRLPAERENRSPTEIESQRQFIRDRILGVSNEALMEDEEAVKLLKTLGGDLMINAFACNFKINGVPNIDVGEANYLNTRIFKRLSVTSMEDNVGEKPLFLTESTFEQDTYGDCLRSYKRRLQLENATNPAIGDLVSLVNVTMSPWPTDSPFLEKMTDEFKKVAKEEIKSTEDTTPLAIFDMHNIRVVIQESLSFNYLQTTYPKKMLFHLYGKGSEYHIDHILKTSPNAQLNADRISINSKTALTEEQLKSGRLVVELQDVFERSLQPLPTEEGQIIRNVPGLSFLPHARYKVKFIDTRTNMQVTTGEIKLGESVYADWLEINMDPDEAPASSKKSLRLK
ncbi:pyridoxal phosphate-dependent transferase [Nemania sp. FL0916]|nr:pyridoxal phosphate-dependent transferase [Nemania sp. FL0916]